jgi:FAD-dependent oxidoreductase domain-containing protein 1
MKVGVVESDPTYRNSLSTTSALGLRMQHSLPENVEMSLFGADFIRNVGRKLAIPFDEVSDDDYFNIPNVKFQPHGHLTLAREDQMQDLMDSHEVQRMSGVQSAMLTPKQINLRFPWIKTQDIAGGCLGLESEGWFDSWNLLQAVKLKNIHQGVDYIDGEVIYCKKHSIDAVASNSPAMDRYEDGSPVPLGRIFEAHVLLPDSQQVYPIHFSTCIMAGGGATGDIGRMAGIGEGYGVLGVEIPVERKRGYVFNVNCKTGPGLNCPLTTDPSGVFLRREGHGGDYLVGKLPDGKIWWVIMWS